MGAGRPGGYADLGDHVGVPDRAVGDQPGGAELPGPQREHVAEGAGVPFAAGVDHHHLTGAQGVEEPFLRVVSAAVGGEQVFAAGYVAQGARGSDQAGARLQRCQPVDGHIVQPAFAHQLGQGGDRDATQPLGVLLAQRGFRGSGELLDGPAGGIRPLFGGRFRLRAVRRQRLAARHRGGREPAGGPLARAHLHLDGLTGAEGGGAGGRTGEDHIARFEGDQLGEVGDDLRQ